VVVDETYVVNHDENLICEGEQSTFHDLTDVFDDSVDRTLMMGSDCEDDLPGKTKL